MKILYLHQYFNTPSMSGGTRSFEMANRLVSKGHEIHMITSWREDDGKKGWFRTEEGGINVHWLPVPYSNLMSYKQRIKAFALFALSAASKASEIGGDLVFATSTPLTIAIPAIRTARKLDIPMVFEVRDLWPELPIAVGALKNPVLKFLAKQLEIKAYKHAKHVVALSPGMAQGVAGAGYPADQITIIPNGADLELFEPSAEKAASFRNSHPELGEDPMVLYAGTLGIINGVSYFAELAEKVENLNPKIRFVVIGKGKEWEKVNARAKEAGILGRNFFMYSEMPKTELVSAFSAAAISTSLFVDIKVMEANSANKFFDTLASATPAAINYGGWQASLLEDHDAGVVLSRNTDEAAVTLNELIGKPHWLKEAGLNARNLAEKEFSRDVLAGKLETVLRNAKEDAV